MWKKHRNKMVQCGNPFIIRLKVMHLEKKIFKGVFRSNRCLWGGKYAEGAKME